MNIAMHFQSFGEHTKDMHRFSFRTPGQSLRRNRANRFWETALVVLTARLLGGCEQPAEALDFGKSPRAEPVQMARVANRPDMYDGVGCHLAQVKMRDGVKLATRIHRPEDSDAKQYPVVVKRTPYARLNGFDCFPENVHHTITAYVNSGYVFVEQAIRGSYTSEGDIPRLIHVEQQNDTYDTVEWAAQQPWSNESVGLQGEVVPLFWTVG